MLGSYFREGSVNDHLLRGAILAFLTRQYGGRKQIILPDGTSPVFPDNPQPDPRTVAIARAHAWMEAMESGQFRTLTQLAQAVGVDEGYVRRQMIEVWNGTISWKT